MSLSTTDLRQALQDIALQAGITIIPDPSVTGLVTADLQNLPLDQALEVVLAGTGYQVREYPNYYLVYSPEPGSPAFAQTCEPRMLRLDYSETSGVMNLLPRIYRDYVAADPKSNTIMITAPPVLAEKIEAYLKRFDTPPRHVLLDARVVVLEDADILNLGVEWNWPTVKAGAFRSSDASGWPWGIEIGLTPGKEFTNALMATLNLLRENEEATIVASPQVMAQDGKPAEIKVATEEYFQIATGGIYERIELEKIETGTLLKILPRISDKGDITLDVAAEVSDVIARGANNLPVVNRRTANSTVRVEDGGTVAIAGLMDARSRQSDRETPYFSAVPLIGRAFDNQTEVESTKQVAVFVHGPLGART